MSDVTIPNSDKDDRSVLGVADVAAELLEDWRWLLGGLHARFETRDFATGVRLVEAIGKVADAADHHPDVELRYGFVQVGLVSHDVGGVTLRDVRLAREISARAGGVGATARPEELRLLELGLDTPDHADIAPFWAAILGMPAPEPDAEDVVDPNALLPAVWFQEPDVDVTAETATPDQRWHPDITVPPEVAERRVRAALEAGGTLISEDRAPSFWVLADAQGNRACICTPLGRTQEVPVDDADPAGEATGEAAGDADGDADGDEA